jgi:hypothetical protein
MMNLLDVIFRRILLAAMCVDVKFPPIILHVCLGKCVLILCEMALNFYEFVGCCKNLSSYTVFCKTMNL